MAGAAESLKALPKEKKQAKVYVLCMQYAQAEPQQPVQSAYIYVHTHLPIIFI